MKDRTWRQICNTVFYIQFLGLYINRKKQINRSIEIVLLLMALFSIAGWNRFAEYHVVWTLILLAVAGVRILKPMLMTSEKEIITLESVRDFYIDKSKDYENLFYKYRQNKISPKQADKEFDRLNEEERLMIKIQKHDQIFGSKKMRQKAEMLSNKVLTKHK